MDRGDLYTTYAAAIESVIASVCHRSRVAREDAEEFASDIRLKIVEDDYAVLRRYNGKSTFTTYLTTVVQHAMLDVRRREWGHWRPSKEAQRLGPIAVDLDRLLTREEMTFDEAVEALRTRGVTASRQELDAIRSKLPPRVPRPVRETEISPSLPDPRGAPDAAVFGAERERRAARAGRALARAVRALAPQDQLLLKLRFLNGFPVSRIAQLIDEEQMAVYRRFTRLLAGLRTTLTAMSITEHDVAELVGDESVTFAAIFSAPVKTDDPCTSIPLLPRECHE